ncbi:MAG: penicillin-binding protein 1A [Proteobacteria bacterium]|nr:penicillin-binding protein 1A [Pseudomonadota bacterium]
MQSKKPIFFILFITICAVTIGVTAGAFYALLNDLPEIRSLNTFHPSSVTRIYSSDNVLLAELFVEKRDPVPLDDIPDTLVKALISTEDRHFFEHTGIYLKGILRAFVKDILAGQFVEGASTITQQLAKTLFLTSQKTLTRKIQEAFLSFQLERRYTKKELLTFYLNQVYFGSGAYGVKSAAAIYFDKDVKVLDLQESAMLIAMLKAPSRYSPHVNMELAITRRNIVLKQMLTEGIIAPPSFDQAIKTDIHIAPKKKISTKAPYFIDYIKNNLPETIDHKLLYQGGLTIQSTLSYELQEFSDFSILKKLEDLKERMKKRGIAEPEPQAALVSMDVKTGGILAMSGGIDYQGSPYNRAVSALRQPGSAFKPFVFALAIEKGFPQNKLILDAPISYTGANENDSWTPQNFSRDYKGEITLREALALSKNIPAIRLIDMLGASSVINFAHAMGIKSRLKPNLSLALGTSEVSLLNLTSAYSIFPNKGEYIEPHGILQILDHNGRSIWRTAPRKKIVMSRSGAAVMTDMLEAVVQEGTGRLAKTIPRPVGGKTGTTDDCKDALFVGFTPSIATGVWVGLDKYETLGAKETGARAALPIWVNFMEKAALKRPYEYFDIPDDTVKIAINTETGKPEAEDSPNAVMALFKKGTEPVQ